MSLLKEIQQECTAKDGDVARLLRLCLQLAARLKHEPLKEWALHELNGYPAGVELPNYRIHKTHSKGFFADRFVGQFTLDIPMQRLEEPLRTRFSEARLDQPIRQYTELLEGETDSGVFQLPWPQDLALYMGPKVSQIQCLRIWQVLPRAAIAGLLDTVKTRVLSMALDIESEHPSAADIAALTPISESAVSQIFNTNIYGGQVGNLAAGSPGAVQKLGNQVVQGDMEALQAYLGAIGVEPADVAQLKDAISVDGAANQSGGIGQAVSRWLSRIGAKAKAMGNDVVVGLATQAILTYLGVSG